MPKSFTGREKPGSEPPSNDDDDDGGVDDGSGGGDMTSASCCGGSTSVCCQVPAICFQQCCVGAGGGGGVGIGGGGGGGGRGDLGSTEKSALVEDGPEKRDGEQKGKVCEVPWPTRALMAPPFYTDLGKNARDVFGKGYHFGLLKLDLKTKTNTGVEFTTGGVQNLETKNVVGSLETKYKFKDYGVTFTEKWNTDNVLATEIALADFCEGAKLTCDTSFIPHKGDKSLRLKAEFKNDMCALNLESDFKSGGPLVKGAAVLGYGGWLCGYATAFDTSRSKLVENKFAMGFTSKDFILHTSINDGRVFTGSIFHKVSNRLETGVQVSWASDSNSTDFGVGCKYSLDPDASVRVKVNNQSLIGLGYSQKLRDGVTVALSTQINGKNIKEGGHNVGFSLELEA